MEELNPSEISQIIKQKIDALDSEPKPGNEGTIVFLADGIARIHGLGEVMTGRRAPAREAAPRVGGGAQAGDLLRAAEPRGERAGAGARAP